MRSETALLIAALLSCVGCADLSRGPPSGDDDAPPVAVDGDAGTGGDGVSFAADVHPLLVSRCQSCHGSGGSAAETAFLLSGDVDADYAVSATFVDASSPEDSRLVSKAAGVGHAGGALLPAGSPEHDTLVLWIAQGASP